MVVENIQFECLQQTKLAGSTPVSATYFCLRRIMDNTLVYEAGN
jgi:hypothetical protein